MAHGPLSTAAGPQAIDPAPSSVPGMARPDPAPGPVRPDRTGAHTPHSYPRLRGVLYFWSNRRMATNRGSRSGWPLRQEGPLLQKGLLLQEGLLL